MICLDTTVFIPWIAAGAKEHGATLKTRNVKDFAEVSGLEVLGY